MELMIPVRLYCAGEYVSSVYLGLTLPILHSDRVEPRVLCM